MTVALDATPLTLTSGGLARYTAELALALAREYPADTFALISDQRFAMPAGAPENLIAPVCGSPVCGSPVCGSLDRRWWLRGVRRAMAGAGAQVFHGTNFEVPYLGSTPAILTIHDLSPWRNPEWHAGPNRVRQRTPWLIRLRRAARILTVSEAVRREIVSHFGVDEDMVRAIPLAASGLFRPVETAPTRRPYFLFVGTLEPRKNLGALVEAWRESGLGRDHDLVIVGRKRKDFVPAAAGEGILYREEVSDPELPGLYSGALAFVYPTQYEGFGLPVLEAMQCGCSVITSRDPAVTEVAGGAALQVDSVAEIAGAMRGLASDAAQRQEMRTRGLARARCFSWSHTARETMGLYREVLAEARTRAGAKD